MILNFFFFFFAYEKFGSHGLFAIYWISRNNRPRCIGATLYYLENYRSCGGMNGTIKSDRRTHGCTYDKR